MKPETEGIVVLTEEQVVHNQQLEQAEHHQISLLKLVLLVAELMVVLAADLEVLEVVVDTMEVAAVHLAQVGAGAAVAAEVAIRIQHFVALLFIPKEHKLSVLALLYMEV